MYCKNCGRQIDNDAAFCPSCGAQTCEVKNTPEKKVANRTEFTAPTPSVKDLIHTKKIEKFCPRCGSQDIDIQVHQEMQGSKTITRTKSKYRQKRHSIFWWLFIGWWWIFIDLFLWIAIFPIRFLIQLFKKKDYKGTSKSVEKTKNKISYRTVFLCKNCGNHWEKQN